MGYKAAESVPTCLQRAGKPRQSPARDTVLFLTASPSVLPFTETDGHCAEGWGGRLCLPGMRAAAPEHVAPRTCQCPEGAHETGAGAPIYPDLPKSLCNFPVIVGEVKGLKAQGMTEKVRVCSEKGFLGPMTAAVLADSLGLRGRAPCAWGAV